MYLVDTSAWIEIFLGTEKGREFEEILSSENNCFSTKIVLSEISKWCSVNNLDREEKIAQVEMACEWIEPEKEAYVNAGNLWLQANKIIGKGKSVGLIDCIIA